jgi:hypothetical protein
MDITTPTSCCTCMHASFSRQFLKDDTLHCVNSSLYLTVQRNIELLNGGVINYDSDKACLIQNYGQLFWYTVCN